MAAVLNDISRFKNQSIDRIMVNEEGIKAARKFYQGCLCLQWNSALHCSGLSFKVMVVFEREKNVVEHVFPGDTTV